MNDKSESREWLLGVCTTLREGDHFIIADQLADHDLVLREALEYLVARVAELDAVTRSLLREVQRVKVGVRSAAHDLRFWSAAALGDGVPASRLDECAAKLDALAPPVDTLAEEKP